MTGQEPTDPFERFYAIRNRQSTAVRKARRSGELAWDPWPVRNAQNDLILEAARRLVWQRNSKCINVCKDKIVLLPASGSVPGVHGGSVDRPLYSIRSSDSLPVRVHIWKIPKVCNRNERAACWNKKYERIMVRRGSISEPLAVFLQSFGVPRSEAIECDVCEHYLCWKGVKLTDKWLNSFPKQLQSLIQKRWFSANGFRFFDLPPELREVVLVFALRSTAAPLKRLRRICANAMAELTVPILNLALVSRRLRGEVTPVVYANTILFIRTTCQFTDLFRKITTSHRDSLVRYLRILQLDMNPRSLLHLLNIGIRIVDAQVTFHYFQDIKEANDLFTLICVKERMLKKVRIGIPHITMTPTHHAPCQKAFCSAVWSGIRGYLRNIPCVEFSGYLDESQKQKWLAQLVKDRKDIMQDTSLLSRKKQVLDVS